MNVSIKDLKNNDYVKIKVKGKNGKEKDEKVPKLNPLSRLLDRSVRKVKKAIRNKVTKGEKVHGPDITVPEMVSIVKKHLPELQAISKGIMHNLAVRKSKREMKRFLNDNPHLKLQLAINQRNAYIDGILGAGAHSKEALMRDNYNRARSVSSDGRVYLQGMKHAY